MIFVFLFYARALQTTDGAQADDVTFCHVVLFSQLLLGRQVDVSASAVQFAYLAKMPRCFVFSVSRCFALLRLQNTKPRDRR